MNVVHEFNEDIAVQTKIICVKLTVLEYKRITAGPCWALSDNQHQSNLIPSSFKTASIITYNHSLLVKLNFHHCQNLTE